MSYDITKLTKLAALKALAERNKTELDSTNARVATLENTVAGIVSTGGEANVLEGVKINGIALEVAEKMVDILIAAGSENGTIAVNGINVAVTGLAALAYKSEITESDLDSALAAVIAAKASKDDVTALQSAIDLLNGTSAEEGSVAYQIAQIVAGVDESYDTLKEIADWISSHTTDAASMNSQINTNKNSIAALTTLIGELPDTATATTIVGYITEVVAAIDLSAYAKTTDLDGLIKLTDISVVTSGTGNVVTAVNYDSGTGILTVVKGTTAAQLSDFSAVSSGDGDIVTDLSYDSSSGTYTATKSISVASDAEVTEVLEEVFGVAEESET